MPPMSAARLKTRSMPRVANSQLEYSRRSSTSNSSASEAVYSGSLRSTPLTQKPSAFRRLTKWCPIKPPAPVTRMRSEFGIAVDLLRGMDEITSVESDTSDGCEPVLGRTWGGYWKTSSPNFGGVDYDPLLHEPAPKPFQRNAHADDRDEDHEMVGHASTECGRETAINQQIQIEGKTTHE